MTDPTPSPRQPMTQTVSAKVAAYAGLAALLLGTALAARQPQLVALGAPFAVALVAGLLSSRRPALATTLTVDDDRVVEGEHFTIGLTIESDLDVDRVELALPLPDGLRYADGVTAPHALRLSAGVPRRLDYPVEADRWGVYRVGNLVVRARGPLGFTSHESARPSEQTVRVYPRSELVRHLARPTRTTPAVGTRLARHKGDGFEFADIRAFLPGDRLRTVNWRATARRGELRVNEHHPERSADVVVLVDAFSNLALPVAVRAAVSVARAYLRDRDRVGVVSFGGTLQWLKLGLGERQLYRIIDALIESSALYSYAWKALDLVPPQALPTGATLVALTPLTDRRTVTALLDRAARGTSVVTIQVSLEPYTPPGSTPTARLGYAMWQHEVARVADRLRERGIPVVRWDETDPLDAAMEEVAAFQRFTRHRTG